MTREEYQAECLSQSLEDAGCGGLIPSDKIAEIAESLYEGFDMQSEAFGDYNIPNPQVTEIKRLEILVKEKQEFNERLEDVWGNAYLRAKGLSPDSYYVSRRGGEITVEARG